jgi:hypothetical protein
MNEILEARKRKFLALKEKAGGAQNLLDSMASAQWRVYFDDQGVITCFTNNTDTPIQPEWRTYDFSREQLQILQGKDLSAYRVHTHPLIDNKYSIEAAREEASPTALATDFLMLVKPGMQDADVYCEVTENSLVVWLSNDVIEQYAKIDPDLAVRKDMSAMRFYITAPNDPHMMFAKVNVKLSELLREPQVKKPLDNDYRMCSIYTKRCFDKYTRLENNG